MSPSPRSATDHDRIARVLRRMTEPRAIPERLQELAADERISPFHLQRSFRRRVGLSPKQFASFVHVCRAKGLLRAARSVLDVALDIGLSGPGRLHDQFVTVTAMSPGEFKAQGAGVAIAYGLGATPFGDAVIAWTPRGICRLSFVKSGDDAAALLGGEFPKATLVRDDAGARRFLARAFVAVRDPRQPLPLLVRGTEFQIAVWRGLLEIPEGSVTSYGALAERIGRRGGERAVGNAVGDNPIAWLIPCHRVIRATGLLGGYRWGLDRKMGMLAAELAGSAQS